MWGSKYREQIESDTHTHKEGEKEREIMHPQHHKLLIVKDSYRRLVI